VDTRLVVFASDANFKLVHKIYNNGWSDWIPLPASDQIFGHPSPIVAGDRLTVFAENFVGRLIHRYWDTNAWTDWIPVMPGPPLPARQITSVPSAVMANGRLVVFARGGDGTLVHTFWDGNAWTPLISLGPELISSAPSAVMAGSRLTVFAMDREGYLTHKFYENGWTPYMRISAEPVGHAVGEDGGLTQDLTGGPSAIMAGDRLTVFFASPTGASDIDGFVGELSHFYYDGGWQGPFQIGPTHSSLDQKLVIHEAPAAIFTGGRPVVFGLLHSGEWRHRYYDNFENDWVDWTPF
jgi:hypothetical protein